MKVIQTATSAAALLAIASVLVAGCASSPSVTEDQAGSATATKAQPKTPAALSPDVMPTARPAPTPAPAPTATTAEPTPDPAPAAEPESAKAAVSLLMQQGMAQQKSGNLEAAYASFSSAVKAEPGNTDAVMQRDAVKVALVRKYEREAAQANQQQNLDLAINKWDQALALDPDNQRAKLERAGARELTRRMSEKFGSAGGWAGPSIGERIPSAQESGENFAIVRVLYATDRNRLRSDKPNRVFGNRRAPITFGYCDVSVPRDHRMGELESPSVWRLEFREDPAKHVVLLRTVIRSRDEFFKELATRVRTSTKVVRLCSSTDTT